MNWSELAGQWRELAISGAEIAGAVVAGFIVYFVARFVLKLVSRRRQDVVVDSFRRHSKRPLRLALPGGDLVAEAEVGGVHKPQDLTGQPRIGLDGNGKLPRPIGRILG